MRQTDEEGGRRSSSLGYGRPKGPKEHRSCVQPNTVDFQTLLKHAINRGVELMWMAKRDKSGQILKRRNNFCLSDLRRMTALCCLTWNKKQSHQYHVIMRKLLHGNVMWLRGKCHIITRKTKLLREKHHIFNDKNNVITIKNHITVIKTSHSYDKNRYYDHNVTLLR